MPKDLDKQTEAVKSMVKDWDVVRPLLSGTTGMRGAGSKLLPAWPHEDTQSYMGRLAVATLFPAYDRTVQTLTGKPFSKPIAIGEDVPDQIKEWLKDIDLQGRNLDTFASNVMESALAYGLSGILVDCPKGAVSANGTGVTTLADEQAAGIRPYFVSINAWQIVGWRSEYQPTQGWTLTQLRLLEEVEEDDGDYDTKIVKQVRVLTVGAWATYRKLNDDSTNNEWTLSEDGTTSLDKIPFVPVYGKRLAFMVGKPPLIELAHMNIKHWQSQSDQDTIMHVARVPILVALGVDDEVTFEVQVGASSCIKLPGGPGVDLKYVEHSGKAIDAGEKSLEVLKDEMRQAGAELLVIGRRMEVTATQVASENELGTCALQRISQGLEDALDYALQFMADYAKLGEGGHVTLFDDFGVSALSDLSAQLLFQINQAGKLSDETFHSEMQRRGILSPDTEWEDEKALIDAQGPQMGALGLDPLTGMPLPQPPFSAPPKPPITPGPAHD